MFTTPIPDKSHGRFYGPQAAEVGGSFAAGSSAGALVGAFAGKR